MAPQEIERALDEKPFIPFRLHLRDGTAWDVLDPSHAFVDMRYVSVGTNPDTESGLFQKSIRISPNHVSRIEPMPESRAS